MDGVYRSKPWVTRRNSIDVCGFMSELDLLEKRLHSWHLRCPSEGLKQRLFAEPVSLLPRMAWFVGWLVPASACALLTLSAFTSGNELPGRSACQPSVVATLLSSQNYLTPAPDNFQDGQNNVLSVTFDLTNRSGSASSIPASTRSRMN